MPALTTVQWKEIEKQYRVGTRTLQASIRSTQMKGATAHRELVEEQIDALRLEISCKKEFGELADLMKTENLVLIAITAGRPRDTQTKMVFYQRLAELLEITPGIRPQDIMVVINTTEADEWSFGNGIATMVAED